MIACQMQILAFSDLHRSDEKAASLVERAGADEVDLVIGAGDFASQHEGLDEAIASLASITKPTLLVPGNNETADALRDAVSKAGWTSAQVLHGDSATVDGKEFFGLGAGIPTTPWDWSFDLTEDEATAALDDCPEGAVLIVHSPPKGHCDQSGSGDHLGSEAIFSAIESKEPPLAVCGHIHEAWGQTSEVGPTRIINLGPDGHLLEV
jgi:Icc-related predicted phosphoesterase